MFVPPTISGTNDTRAGIGLRYEFGDNAVEVVGTVRQTYTDTNNTVTGGLGEIAFPFVSQRKRLPKLRVMGLYGSPSIQGEAGLGYDFANQQPLLGLGVQGPYVEGGVNVLLNQEFHPLSRGFDEYFGFLAGANSYLDQFAWRPRCRR